MRTPTQEELIQILRFEIRGTPLPQGFAVSDEAALVQLAKNHDLTHFVYDALTKNGLPCTSQFAMQQYFASIWRAEQMGHELLNTAELFEKEGIDFIPLKGAVMRPMYPESWMRTSADIDILVREADLNRAIALTTEKLGYTLDTSNISFHHEVLTAPKNNVNVELHHALFEGDQVSNSIKTITDGIWNPAAGSKGDSNTEKAGWNHWYLMSDAMFYFYHIAHMAKHLTESGGCPIRGIIDLWILNRLRNRNEEERSALLEKGGLNTFASKMSALAKMWIDDDLPESNSSLSEELDELEQFIMTDGLYGSSERRITNGVGQIGTLNYLKKRLIIPYESLKYSYPVLQKHKWLTPVFEAVRWTRIFRKDYQRSFMKQTDALIHPNNENMHRAKRINSILDIERL